MSKNLLSKSKLPYFIKWLEFNNIEFRNGRGDYQVLQVMTLKTFWQCIFDRHNAIEHYTVAKPLEQIVRKFIKDSKTPAKSTLHDTDT